MNETPVGFREALIDLDALAANVRHLKALAGGREVMVVVKAFGYGHGMIPVAKAALAAGASWLGTADLDEALALRAAGIDAPILAWLHDPGRDFAPAITAGIDIGISSLHQLDHAIAAARRLAIPARLQVKVDTGLSRNGVAPDDLPALLARASRASREGVVKLHGIFSHLANASAQADREAAERFAHAVRAARSAGLAPELTHMDASAALLGDASPTGNLVRLGISIYGLSPLANKTSQDLGLTPVMRLATRVAAVRRVPAGSGVSYDYTYTTTKDTTLALVPLGYADGIPRQASSTGPVTVAGLPYRVAGRVAMDQFVVDVGDADVRVGDEVVIFGSGAAGEPTADQWAQAADTINYEIVTRIGPRVQRHYVGGPDRAAQAGELGRVSQLGQNVRSAPIAELWRVGDLCEPGRVSRLGQVGQAANTDRSECSPDAG